MTEHYQDYVWKNGIPYGIHPEDTNKIQQDQTTYKIAMDPYRKRISIEKYKDLKFVQLIYDSFLLDFRSLKPAEQTAWQKTLIEETPSSTKCIIRNQDDRVVFFEECFFENNLCRECRVTSPQGILLSVHKMYYQAFNDPYNGIKLFDANEHPVMSKRYSVDEQTGEFQELLSEHWESNLESRKNQ